jgi:hypothetical protein
MYRSIHGKDSRSTSGTGVAVVSATAVAVAPAGAGDVAVGAGEVAVGGLVGVASSPAHARATTIMVAARIAIMGLKCNELRNAMSHLPIR